jgi:D-serine deaminase-like pyridoxal phosphate-dependent protein
LGHDELTVARPSEEHAVLTALAKTGLVIGDRVAIIPTHVCTTVNLYSSVLLASSSESDSMRVDARGWR